MFFYNENVVKHKNNLSRNFIFNEDFRNLMVINFVNSISKPLFKSVNIIVEWRTVDFQKLVFVVILAAFREFDGRVTFRIR